LTLGTILVGSGFFLIHITHLFLFAGILVLLIQLERSFPWNALFKKFALTLGNLTYSSYLIHVPLQIAFLVMIRETSINQFQLVSSRVFFIGWFMLVLGLSLITYIKFETPARHLVLRKLRTY
jgi:peptidoglycan/LPS O-acetylase OafA/YrhL